MSIIAGAFLSLALPASDAALLQEKDPNKIICKSEENTGSRLQRRRICRTRAEWAELDSQNSRRPSGSPFRNQGSNVPVGPI